MGDLSFYKAVMSTPMVPRPLSPKSKGKKAKVKKLKPAFFAEKIDLFKTFLSADAGKESMHRPHDFFELNLKKLSKGELQKLLEKIEHMREFCLKEGEGYQVVDLLYEKTRVAIESQLKQSELAIQKLKTKVVGHLQKMPPLEAKILGSNVFIFKKTCCTRFSRFIEQDFSFLIREYEKLVSEGVIIPSTKSEKGVDFIKSTLYPFLHFR